MMFLRPGPLKIAMFQAQDAPGSSWRPLFWVQELASPLRILVPFVEEHYCKPKLGPRPGLKILLAQKRQDSRFAIRVISSWEDSMNTRVWRDFHLFVSLFVSCGFRPLFSLTLYVLRQGLMWPTLALNSLHNQGQPWSLDLSSISTCWDYRHAPPWLADHFSIIPAPRGLTPSPDLRNTHTLVTYIPQTLTPKQKWDKLFKIK